MRFFKTKKEWELAHKREKTQLKAIKTELPKQLQTKSKETLIKIMTEYITFDKAEKYQEWDPGWHKAGVLYKNKITIPKY